MNAIGFCLVAMFLELAIGKISFVILYAVTGICSSITSIWWHSNGVSAGASGAIFGLYGFARATLIIASKKDRSMNSQHALIFVMYDLIMGLSGNVDNAAHISGLVSGFIIGATAVFIQIIRGSQEKMNTDRNYLS